MLKCQHLRPTDQVRYNINNNVRNYTGICFLVTGF